MVWSHRLKVAAIALLAPAIVLLLIAQHTVSMPMAMAVGVPHNTSNVNCPNLCSGNMLVNQIDKIRAIRIEVEPTPPPIPWLLASAAITTAILVRARRSLRFFDIPLYKWCVCYLS